MSSPLDVWAGASAFAVCTAAVLTAALCVGRFLYPDRPWSRVAVSALTGMTIVVISQQLLGAVEALRPGPLAELVLSISAGVVAATHRKARRPVVRLRWPLSRGWTLALLGGVIACFVISIAFFTTNSDALIYHYPLVADWLRSGSLIEPHGYVRSYFVWFYPSNVELLHAWLVVWTPFDFLLGGVALITYASVFGAVTGLVRFVAGQLESARLAAAAPLVGAVWCLAPMTVVSSLTTSGVDSAMTACIVIAITFGLRWWIEAGPSAVGWRAHRDLWVAALSLGLALGSKYPAVPFVALLLCVFAAALGWSLGRHAVTPRHVFGLAGGTAGLVALPSAFWYVRNLAVVGNPIYPSGALALPDGNSLAGLSEGYEHLGHSLLEVVASGGRWVPLFLLAFVGALALLVPVAAVWNPLVLWRQRRASRIAPSLFVVFGLVPAAFLVAYVVMPETGVGPRSFPFGVAVNARYGMPAFLMVLVAFAVATATRRPTKARFRLLWALLAVNVLHVLAFTWRTSYKSEVSPRKVVLGSILVGCVFVLVTWLVGRTGVSVTLRRRVIGAVAGAVMLVAVAHGAASSTTANRTHLLGPHLGPLAARQILADDSEVDCVVHSSSVGRTYPMYGRRYRTKVLLAAAQVSPGTYRNLESVDALVDLMLEEDCPWLLTRNDNITDRYLRADSELSLLAWAGSYGHGRDYERAVTAMWERWLETPEFHWAQEKPDLFRLVDSEGPFRLYRLRAEVAR